MIERGGGTGTLDGETHQLMNGSLANVPTGCVHAYSFTPGTEGWVDVGFDPTLFDANGRKAVTLTNIGDVLSNLDVELEPIEPGDVPP